MTLRVGQDVVISAGMWVHSQSPTQLVMDRWTKIMIIKPVKARIESISADGWLILVDDSSKVRYKAWSTALEPCNG